MKLMVGSGFPACRRASARRRLMAKFGCGLIAIVLLSAAGLAEDFAGFPDAMKRGRELFTQKQYEQALHAYQFAFSRAQTPKESAQATARIGEALGELGKTREAIEFMQRSLDFFHYDQVEQELKDMRAKMAGKVQTSDEITAALHDQQESNRGTRVMPRRPLALQINFEFNKAALTEQGRQQVDQLGASLQGVVRGIEVNGKGERILITGHTDLVGTPEYNQKLSEQRALAVAAEIERKFGVPRAMLVTEGKGMRQPLYNSTSPEDSRLNRRVEVTVLKPGEAGAQ